jgi:hypothetical protein
MSAPTCPRGAPATIARRRAVQRCRACRAADEAAEVFARWTASWVGQPGEAEVIEQDRRELLRGPWDRPAVRARLREVHP